MQIPLKLSKCSSLKAIKLIVYNKMSLKFKLCCGMIVEFWYNQIRWNSAEKQRRDSCMLRITIKWEKSA